MFLKNVSSGTQFSIFYVAGFVLMITLPSCITTKKVDKWIAKEYESSYPVKPKTNDYLILKSEVSTPVAENKLSDTKKDKSNLIPALLYWHWEYSTMSTLNAGIPLNNLNAAIFQYANSKNLRQKLNGQKLELTVQKMPAAFSLTDKGNMVFVVLYYFGWERIYVSPVKEDLVITYRLLNDNAEIKKGTITIASHDKDISEKIFQATRKMLWKYLDQYNDNIKLMGREAVDKLIQELPVS